MKRRPDESAALRALRESLAEDGGGHPAEELLLAYADERSSLAQDVVEEIDTHLATCASCRDEVGVLGSLTISPAREAQATVARTEAAFWQRIVSVLSGPVWRPALAFAVLIVLTVPVLRMVGQDRAMLFEAIDHHDDVAMTVNDAPRFERPRANEVGAAADVVEGAAERKSDARAGGNAERRAITNALAPTAPSAHRGVTVPPTAVPPPPSAAGLAEAPPSPAPAPLASPAPQVDEAHMAERQMRAARESDSRLSNAFAARGMAKQRIDEPRSLAPTIDYVPGGQVAITPDGAERVTLRILFVRDDGERVETRSGGPAVGQAGAGVMIAPSATEVDVVVISADGRRNSRRVEVGQGRATVSSVEIPVDWLAAGANQVDVIDGDGRRLGEASFVIERL